MRVFNHIIYLINSIYLALMPTVAMIVQGETNYEYLERFPLLPDFTGKILNAFVWVFGIVLIPILLQTVKNADSWSSISFLLGGPLLGYIVTQFIGTPFQNTFFHIFLIEGAAFLLIIIFQYFLHRKEGLKKAGSFMVYVFTPFFFLVLVIGFLSAINYDFFFKHYQTIWDYLALFAMIAIGIMGLFSFMKKTDNQLLKVNRSLSTNEKNKSESSYSFIGVVILIGIVAFTIRGWFL